ncbi:Cytidylate kinase [Borrelia miyamotoi]|uniref:Cytidylate kinase n=1 Tax=Borrelia miyamotoi TaxID=47466 RepID=A0AAQ2WVU6_9SPIR|nr:cytidylate kinase family protein [Borrelia miyamotoi]AGT27758.1 cytidylate kinase [Borrelia miyamotoi LB-2001]AHH04572.1 Cytidylate kinase [Borrelia miyamotoi FR64b]AJA58904.1 cytidylate kinase [Borrelia miyamotoi]AOW95998.1 cytidylate kinase [Borrelia miyamotoi]ATQ14452.1 AAA family ATPase [Borrelia miyamotoi]
MRIAVSGKSGCGNTTISGLLAQHYGLKLINYTFHDIAREKNMSFDKFYEKEIIGRNDYYWDEYLDSKLLEFSKEDNTVLASRLAIWLSKNADLRIYLYAKIEIRAERIINREGGMYSDILRSTFNRDSNDSRRYLSVYNINVDNYLDVADFIVDTTDRSANKVFELIKNEIEKRNLYKLNR